MENPNQPTLAEDSKDRKKIKVSLPGGRYQLSLDGPGVVLIEQELGYERGHVLPDLLVKVLVASGDAWFPNQRDYQGVVEDIQETNTASDWELQALADYLRSRNVPEARASLVRDIVEDSPLQDYLDPSDMAVNELPTAPPGIFDDPV